MGFPQMVICFIAIDNDQAIPASVFDILLRVLSFSV